MAVERQASTLPPPQPVYILRGHAAQIHSVQFAHQNRRLLTGDAEGWVVFWKVETKRALVVWRAHHGAILGTAPWCPDRIITHGRDDTLRIWQLRHEDETNLSNELPAESTGHHRPKPWLLHTLPVNTLNFCAFSMYKHGRQDEPILIAVPGRDDKKIEVYQFPDEKLNFIVPRPQSTDTGMVMAVKLVYHQTSRNLLILAGYEGGFTTVHILPQNHADSAVDLAQLVYLSQPHTQPILSLDISPDTEVFFTSSADAIIAAHRIPDLPVNTLNGHNASSHEGEDQEESYSKIDHDDQTLETSQKHESLRTTKPDPAPSISTKENGQVIEPSNAPSEPLDFSKKPVPPNLATPSLSFSKSPVPSANTKTPQPSGLSSLLSSTNSNPNGSSSAPPTLPPVTLQLAYKTTNTKHAGQQSLRVRSDGRLLVTGGWDKRIRIYSSKSLKEVAVLKWHKEGVYAVAFSEILSEDDLKRQDSQVPSEHDESTDVVKRETGLGRLQRQREEQMQLKHWVAAGAKDGKVSLWEVF